jgi:hypothetical protein
MTVEVLVQDQYQLKSPCIKIHDTEVWTLEARLAMSLVERWGMVAAAPDGEDSAGRAKGRLQSPEELVSRACRAAELVAAECRARGWFVEAPSWAEVEKQAEALRKEAEKEYGQRRRGRE